MDERSYDFFMPENLGRIYIYFEESENLCYPKFSIVY